MKPVFPTSLRYILLLFSTLLLLSGCREHALESIVITPADKTDGAKSSSIDYTAKGKYTDDVDEDLTSSVTWTRERKDGSSDTSSFSSEKAGRFNTGSTVGSFNIYAEFKDSNSSSTTGSTTIKGDTTLIVK